jgi:subtilisin-like proprotein convertase family protein
MAGVKITGTLGLALVVALLAAPSASAGVATYNSTGPLHVGDDNAPNGVTSTITVPPGRTAVQTVEIVNFRVQWAASAQEMSARVEAPDGTPVQLFDEGCFDYEQKDVWGFSDAAAQLTWNDKDDARCDLPGGTFRPVEQLSAFSGKAAPGAWRLRAIDNGVQFTNQGDIESWAVRITHAPPVLNVTPPQSADLDRKLKVFATANADGSAAANAGSVNLGPGQQAAVPFKVSKKTRKKVAKKGKARVTVAVSFTDVTGGTASAATVVKVTD